jgi:hypothetical protein
MRRGTLQALGSNRGGRVLRLILKLEEKLITVAQKAPLIPRRKRELPIVQ